MTKKTTPTNSGPVKREKIQIERANIQTVVFDIIGTAPYMQARFSAKSIQAMKANMLAGSQKNKGAKRPPRNFKQDFEDAKHKSTQGWCGIPCAAFRNAMISACRVCGFKMTQAKLAVFLEADGFDALDGIPLVKLKGTPKMHEMHARNSNGEPDIRVRPMWETWSAKIRVNYDADLFSVADVSNLLARAGMQVGIGEGRHDSKKSAGLGLGTFRIA